jgi:hypothetical protein
LENKFPCICGHSFEDHYDPDDDDNVSIPIYGEGRCNAWHKPSGHWCPNCGDDSSNYCQCLVYHPDNLKYLERKDSEQRV